MLRPSKLDVLEKKNKSSVAGARERVVRDVIGEKPGSSIPQALIGQGKNLGLCSQYEEGGWVCKDFHFKGITRCSLENRLGGDAGGKGES